MALVTTVPDPEQYSAAQLDMEAPGLLHRRRALGQGVSKPGLAGKA